MVLAFAMALAALNEYVVDAGGTRPDLALSSSGSSEPAETSVAEQAPEPLAPTTSDDGGERIDGGISTLEQGRLLWVDPTSSGRPWSELGAVDGLLGFRGSPTRTFYGRGPVPADPSVFWTATIGCSTSLVGKEAKEWCGTGWTGQPVVFRSPEVHGGKWWVAVGGYNQSVNFYDPATGEVVFPAYATGDIIKGTVAVDPDGFPLLYTGSRDGFFHVVALDRDKPETLWQLSADDELPTLWNDDWDSSALVIDDYLFVGGENSRFYGVRLHRATGPDGLVTVDPEVIFSVAGWDDELLADTGDRQMSIEGSVAMSGNVVYFSNSGGLVQGWDISAIDADGEPERVFRYWTGDDTDASVVIDAEGMLYVASEYERLNQRSAEIGQVVKLDPSRSDDPLVWSRRVEVGAGSGVWATPALHDDLLIVATDDGRLLGLDRDDGATRWELDLGASLWSSPVVVDGTLIQGACDGKLRGYELHQNRAPTERWMVELGGCIESTPAVWDGSIFVGARDGDFYAITDRGSEP